MSVYSPVVNAFGQDTYFDQQGTALAGMLANASDINLVDAAVVGEELDFAVCGRFYPLKVDTSIIRPGVNTEKITSYDDATLSSPPDEWCVVVRNQQVQTNAENESGWESKRMANVLRTSRVGGRIWVEGITGQTAMAQGNFYVVSAVASGEAKVGQLTSDSSITGATLSTKALIGAKMLGATPPDSNGHCLVLIEFHNTDFAS